MDGFEASLQVDLYPIVVESVGTDSGIVSNCDNFYLDMNGIIHSCTHSNDDKLVTLKEQEMFMRIFSYTDRLYKLVKPRKLMFLAIDGVAPRAKMNQQRARRFRSSKEREALIADHVAKEGKMPELESFDSNCITPGTEFMHKLGIAFRRWIQYKQETDSFWRQNGAEIVFSGPDVPGEGEHKVMDMIREQRRQEEEKQQYLPGKLRHCMYGLDADLIMLSLVTHEPLFVLLREKINKRNKDAMTFAPEDFELLEVSVLRQMLKQHFRKLSDSGESYASANTNEAAVEVVAVEDSSAGGPAVLRKKTIRNFDLERIIDDFVFMCFFIGNDFLPCDIADGSLNLMMTIYRDMLPQLGGYLTDKESIHLPRVELFLQEIARREPLYFQQRAIEEQDDAYASDDYRKHYYKVKFGVDVNDHASVRKIVLSYLEGLYWVLTYYHRGCKSWTWFYPYLYAPLASDVRNLAELNIEFEVGRPFTPLLQLLSVLPPQSGKFLPESYQRIMTSPDSELAEYYPKDFSVDANGKKNSWDAIDHSKVLTDSERQRNIAASVRKQPAEKSRWGSALDSGGGTWRQSDRPRSGNSNGNSNSNSNSRKKSYYKQPNT
eukprot:gene31378-40766_t